MLIVGNRNEAISSIFVELVTEIINKSSECLPWFSSSPSLYSGSLWKCKYHLFYRVTKLKIYIETKNDSILMKVKFAVGTKLPTFKYTFFYADVFISTRHSIVWKYLYSENFNARLPYKVTMIIAYIYCPLIHVAYKDNMIIAYIYCPLIHVAYKDTMIIAYIYCPLIHVAYKDTMIIAYIYCPFASCGSRHFSY